MPRYRDDWLIDKVLIGKFIQIRCRPKSSFLLSFVLVELGRWPIERQAGERPARWCATELHTVAHPHARSRISLRAAKHRHTTTQTT